MVQHPRAAAVLVMAGLLTMAGCGRRTASTGPAGVTFTRDVAPIVYRHCAPCHRPDGAAPFPLLTYPDVARRARQIASITARREMPPWKPAAGHGEFEGERRLSEAEIAVLARWAAAGAPEGDPADLPPAPVFAEGWQLGKPDLVVRVREPVVVPADGPDVFTSVRVPTGLGAVRFVRGFELRPGGRHVVHHAMVRLARAAGQGARAAEGPALGGMLAGAEEAESPGGHVLGWAPGYAPYRAPDGMPWRLEPGVDLVLELHLRPAGDEQVVQPEIGLFFTDTPPSRTPFGLQLGSYTIDIPPGERDYVIEDRYALPVDVEVHTIYPHAHYLGKDLRAWAELPDGSRRELIWIPDWDFNWQSAYRYRTPVVLPRGTEIWMRYVYDNSASNPHNPARPPVRVRYGGRSSDEMGNLWLQVVTRRPEDLAVLERDYAVKSALRIADAYERLRREQPGSAAVERGLGTALLQAGRVDAALVHLQAAHALDPGDATVLYNLGHALVHLGRLAEAEDRFRRAAAIEPAFADAWNNLGELRRARGDLAGALSAYRQAVAAAPQIARFHANMGAALRASGRLDAARSAYERALALDPTLADALFGLGRVHHEAGRLDEAANAYRRALAAVPTHVGALNGLAWLLATSPETGGAGEAVALAERLVALTREDDASALDTLAAAYAAAGRFEEARAAAGAARERARRDGQRRLATEIDARLALYREGRPYRDR
jgi:tetratricopeptide (TPR) repeat protein/mono/diheme cytochrome c family protein